MGRKSTTLSSLLDRTIEKETCKLFTGCKDKDGYGITSVKGKKMSAHRAAYILKNGDTPLYILHTCTNRDCINPEHLYAGDQKQNVLDQIKAGTFVFGSKNGKAKLSEELVKEIRNNHISNREWATRLSLSYHTIWDARKRSWKKVL